MTPSSSARRRTTALWVLFLLGALGWYLWRNVHGTAPNQAVSYALLLVWTGVGILSVLAQRTAGDRRWDWTRAPAFRAFLLGLLLGTALGVLDGTDPRAWTWREDSTLGFAFSGLLAFPDLLALIHRRPQRRSAGEQGA